MITRISIDNIGCLEEFTLEPDRVNLLIGANGSGKTTVLAVLARVAALVVDGVDLAWLFRDFSRTRWRSDTSQRIEITLDGNGGEYRYRLEVENRGDGNAKILLEKVTFDQAVLFEHFDETVHLFNDEGTDRAFPFGRSRSFLPELQGRAPTQKLDWLLRFFSRFWLLRLDPRTMVTDTKTGSSRLEADGSNFASWYRHLCEQGDLASTAVSERLNPILPGFYSMELIRGNAVGTKQYLIIDRSGKQYEFGELSDGEKALIVLYTLLEVVQDSPPVLLMDEPENFVGLTEIKPWLQDLSDEVRDEGQLFVVSHHPEVVNYLAADRPLLFSRIDGGPTTVRTDVFDRDTGLRASDQLLRGYVHGA